MDPIIRIPTESPAAPPSEAPRGRILGRLTDLTSLAALATTAFSFGCRRAPSSNVPLEKGSPPENSSLVIGIPTPEQISNSIKGKFQGTAPANSQEMEVYKRFLHLAAFHPLKDWEFTEKARKCSGYAYAAWGERKYVLRIDDHRYEVHEEVETGYDERMVAATAILVTEGKQMAPNGIGGYSQLYCNDDWAALPFKILEERFDLEKKRLSWRAPFIETTMRPEAWSMPVSLPTPPQPAPLAIVTFDQIPPGFGKTWKGRGPEGKFERFLYAQAHNVAAILPLEQWKFEETITEDFGKPLTTWGFRRFRTQIEYPKKDFHDGACVRSFLVQDEVRHNGQHLVSHCTLSVEDTKVSDGSKTESLRVDGGWAEIPCQFLETRYFLHHGILPRRVPYITTPTTPGSFVR